MSGGAQRRAGTADDVASGTAKLDVDDAVEDKVDGEVDQEQTVGDHRCHLVGVVHLITGRLRTTRLQLVRPEEIQQSRRSWSP